MLVTHFCKAASISSAWTLLDKRKVLTICIALLVTLPFTSGSDSHHLLLLAFVTTNFLLRLDSVKKFATSYCNRPLLHFNATGNDDVPTNETRLLLDKTSHDGTDDQHRSDIALCAIATKKIEKKTHNKISMQAQSQPRESHEQERRTWGTRKNGCAGLWYKVVARFSMSRCTSSWLLWFSPLSQILPYIRILALQFLSEILKLQFLTRINTRFTLINPNPHHRVSGCYIDAQGALGSFPLDPGGKLWYFPSAWTVPCGKFEPCCSAFVRRGGPVPA